MARVGAVPMELMTTPTGATFISVESLVALFRDMSTSMEPGSHGAETFALLISTFEPMADVASLKIVAGADDNSRPVGLYCECGQAVIDAVQLDDVIVRVNADKEPVAGEFIVFRVKAGVVTVAPYNHALMDGLPYLRLTAHTCPAAGQ